MSEFEIETENEILVFLPINDWQ